MVDPPTSREPTPSERAAERAASAGQRMVELAARARDLSDQAALGIGSTTEDAERAARRLVAARGYAAAAAAHAAAAREAAACAHDRAAAAHDAAAAAGHGHGDAPAHRRQAQQHREAAVADRRGVDTSAIPREAPEPSRAIGSSSER
jgi:hypothetical protein